MIQSKASEKLSFKEELSVSVNQAVNQGLE